MTEAKPYISSGALHGQSRKTHTDTHVNLEALLIYGAYERLFHHVEFVRYIDVCMGV